MSRAWGGAEVCRGERSGASSFPCCRPPAVSCLRIPSLDGRCPVVNHRPPTAPGSPSCPRSLSKGCQGLSEKLLSAFIVKSRRICVEGTSGMKQSRGDGAGFSGKSAILRWKKRADGDGWMADFTCTDFIL